VGSGDVADKELLVGKLSLYPCKAASKEDLEMNQWYLNRSNNFNDEDLAEDSCPSMYPCKATFKKRELSMERRSIAGESDR
jgi:hypothetical protein